MRGMSGPEHYREAERLLEEVEQTYIANVGDPWCAAQEVRYVHDPHARALIVQTAQVHATLAAAAATIDDAIPQRATAWSEVLA